ncbi:hypothetical protein Tco_0764262, partial [Tanacetum coccineum]
MRMGTAMRMRLRNGDEDVENDDSNVIPDSSNMCDNDNQADQNVEECDDERVVLANLIANLKLDINENKKIQKQLNKWKIPKKESTYDGDTKGMLLIVKLLEGHGYPVIAVAWNHGENLLASSDFGGTGWQGKEASFMKSNEHGGRERQRHWDTSGLEGVALKLVEGDKSAKNWWKKLEVIRDLVVGTKDGAERLDALVYAAVYFHTP